MNKRLILITLVISLLAVGCKKTENFGLKDSGNTKIKFTASTTPLALVRQNIPLKCTITFGGIQSIQTDTGIKQDEWQYENINYYYQGKTFVIAQNKDKKFYFLMANNKEYSWIEGSKTGHYTITDFSDKPDTYGVAYPYECETWENPDPKLFELPKDVEFKEKKY
jgi:hypothetical protein